MHAEKSNFKFYCQEANDEVVRKLTGESKLRLALKQGEYSIISKSWIQVFAGIEGQYSNRRKTLSLNCTGNFFITNSSPLGKNIARCFDVSASVYNLLGALQA